MADGVLVRIDNGDGFAWGDTILGNVILYPQNETIEVAEVAVSIVEQDVDGFVEANAFAAHGMPGESPAIYGEMAPDVAPAIDYREQIIASNLTLTPSSEPREIPFSLTVPHGVSLSNSYYIAVNVAVSSDNMPDLTDAEPFVLLPPKFAQSLILALQEFGAFEAIYLRVEPKEDGTGDQYDLNFAAPEDLKKYLDGVRFLVSESGENITGELEINPQEHTLLEHLESLIHADRIRFPISFVKSELVDAASQGLASKEALIRLHELIDPYLKDR